MLAVRPLTVGPFLLFLILGALILVLLIPHSSSSGGEEKAEIGTGSAGHFYEGGRDSKRSTTTWFSRRGGLLRESSVAERLVSSQWFKEEVKEELRNQLLEARRGGEQRLLHKQLPFSVGGGSNRREEKKPPVNQGEEGRGTEYPLGTAAATSSSTSNTSLAELLDFSKWLPPYNPEDKYSLKPTALSEEEVAAESLQGMTPNPSTAQYPKGTADCIQSISCDFYSDVLLVIKVNPMRFLAVEMMLNFYSTGFKNIVFYSSLKRGDNSTSKYMRVGPRRIYIRMLDDQYGYCDFTTLSDAIDLYGGGGSGGSGGGGFAGFLYLHDDMLFQYWMGTKLNKNTIWRQTPRVNPTGGKNMKIHEGTREGMIAIRNQHKLLGMPDPASKAFLAETSGAYYLPNFRSSSSSSGGNNSKVITPPSPQQQQGDDQDEEGEEHNVKGNSRGKVQPPKDYSEEEKVKKGDCVRRVYPLMSKVLTEHKAFIEWATPALLFAVQRECKLERPAQFDGKLMWGKDRITVKTILKKHSHRFWFHPIKYQSEVITRLLIHLHETKDKSLPLPSASYLAKSKGPPADPTARGYQWFHKVPWANLFGEKCLICATYERKRIHVKGLLHGCVVAEDDWKCQEGNATESPHYTRGVPKLPPGAGLPAAFGGRVHVPNSRKFQKSPLEVDYEGIWQKEITEFIYRDYFDRFNHTQYSGQYLMPYPECCFEKTN